MTAPLVLDEARVRALVDPASALEAVRAAFVAHHRGRSTLPAIMDLEFPDARGEAHVKGAHLHGADTWAVKVASGFYDNARRGLPVTSGLSVVLSARTGLPEAVLLDNGFLTELRTGAAGALAADLLARPDADSVLLVGAGGQARYQLEALLGVRDPSRIAVWARRPEQARETAQQLALAHGRRVEAVGDLAAAVAGADVVVTVTPAREPLIRAAWLAPGTHVTAVGSDMPGKRELAGDVLARADVVCVDEPAVAAANGELQHGLRERVLELDDVVTLGAVAAGDASGRVRPEQITVADLCGLGVQDAAVAEVALQAARASAQPTTTEVPPRAKR